MKSLMIFILTIVCITAGCNRVPEDLNYELVTYSGDLKVESFDSTVTNVNRYNFNNRLYPVGAAYLYSYQYYDKNGEPLNFQFIDDGWEFVDPEPGDSNELVLKIRSGLEPFSNWYPDYNQTVLTYQLSNKDSYEMTGLIENEANVWLHPPREGLFRIMELNPFPSVKYPLEVGQRWEWPLTIGNGWGDERWMTWDGAITSLTTYEITKSDTVITAWGELATWTVYAESVSELGSTTMEAVYNDSLGFLKMDYENIDGSRINFNLREAKK